MTEISVVQTDLLNPNTRKPLLLVLGGMDKVEDLAYVFPLFDVDEVSAVLWCDALLIKWFIGQGSLTGSKATQDGWHGGGLVQDTIQQASKTLK